MPLTVGRVHDATVNAGRDDALHDYCASTAIERLSPAARRAWRDTFLAPLSSQVTARLLDRASEARLVAGEVFYRGAHHAGTATLAIVADGLLRVYLAAPDGREVTIRYAAHGSVVGATSLVLGSAPGLGGQGRLSLHGGNALHIKALQPSHVLMLPVSTFLRVAQTDVQVAWPLAEHVAHEAAAAQQVLADDVFLPVRCRVARHLLDLAVRDGHELSVTASHQDIADAIGTVREVVSRALGKLQAEKLIVRREGRIVVLDPQRLLAASCTRKAARADRWESDE